jgi:hypothetical protein
MTNSKKSISSISDLKMKLGSILPPSPGGLKKKNQSREEKGGGSEKGKNR